MAFATETMSDDFIVRYAENCFGKGDLFYGAFVGLLDIRMDASASRLAGQPDFTRKGDNRPAPAARDSLCWPYGVDASSSTLAIGDFGNNRVLLSEAAP